MSQLSGVNLNSWVLEMMVGAHGMVRLWSTRICSEQSCKIPREDSSHLRRMRGEVGRLFRPLPKKSCNCKSFGPLPSKISPRIWVNIQGNDMCSQIRGKHHVHLNIGLCWPASKRGRHFGSAPYWTFYRRGHSNKLPSSQ